MICIVLQWSIFSDWIPALTGQILNYWRTRKISCNMVFIIHFNIRYTQVRMILYWTFSFLLCSVNQDPLCFRHTIIWIRWVAQEEGGSCNELFLLPCYLDDVYSSPARNPVWYFSFSHVLCGYWRGFLNNYITLLKMMMKYI